ncbi:uncharacterized protein LOC134684818 [Mytilus trossulus]|uniref:uncharacterized protein LOC134684818 n=1 Tax=Mytilus trossulus TaxID=6551 RepID=UPI003006F9FA
MASLTACILFVFLNFQLQAVVGQHLLVANVNDLSGKSGGISLIDVNNRNAVPISRNIGRAWFMAYHKNTSYIYWTEIGKNSIFRIRYPSNERNLVETVVRPANPTGIALDQIENHLYWTESLLNNIFRCNLDGSEVTVILNSSLEYPHAIAIHSRTRMMYFSYTDNNHNAIGRCRLDGSERQTLITESMGIGKVYDIAMMLQDVHFTGQTVTSDQLRVPATLYIVRHTHPQLKFLSFVLIDCYVYTNYIINVLCTTSVPRSTQNIQALPTKDEDEDASLSGGGIILGYGIGSVIFFTVTLGPSFVMLSLCTGNKLYRRLRKNRLNQNPQHNNTRMSSIEADYDTIADDKFNVIKMSFVDDKCTTINKSVGEKRDSNHVPELVTFVNSIKYENTVNLNPYISMTTSSTVPKNENTQNKDTYMPMISRADTHKYDTVTNAIVHSSQLESPFPGKIKNTLNEVTDTTGRFAGGERSCTEKSTDNQNYYNC